MSNSFFCWYCSKEFFYDGEKYRDVNCTFCGIQNSIYDPEQSDWKPDNPTTTEEEWLQESEEEMPFDKPSKDYLSLPKVGQEYDFSQHGEVTEIKKIEGGKGFNFTKKETLILPDGTTATVNKDLGYRYAIKFEDGKILTVSSWAPYYAMEEAGVIEGCKFILKHFEKGKWECLII